MNAARQRWQLCLAVLGGGALTPLCLLLADGSLPVLLAAVLLLLLESLAIRYLIVKVPHTRGFATHLRKST